MCGLITLFIFDDLSVVYQLCEKTLSQLPTNSKDSSLNDVSEKRNRSKAKKYDHVLAEMKYRL